MRFVWLFPLALLAQLLVLGATMSVTIDEIGHLGGGLYVWDYGRFDVYRVNPPLVRTIACAPVALLNPTRDYSRYVDSPATRVEWLLGGNLIAANPDDWKWYVVLARWMVAPITLVGAWFAFWWAQELYGSSRGTGPSTCGAVALVLFCFCPNILAWGATITPDAAAASLGLAAGYSFWKWLREPTWRRTIVAGVWLGLAELTKFSWIILFPLWPLLWLMWRTTESRRSGLVPCHSFNVGWPVLEGFAETPVITAVSSNVITAATRIFSCDTALATDGRDSSPGRPSLLQLTAILGLAVYAINLGYAFEGSFTPIKDFVFVSRTLAGAESKPDRKSGGNRFRESWIGEIRVPAPFNYLRGIDLQKVDFEEGKRSYLNGVWSDRGWWYYYLYAAALKVPLGAWLLGSLVLLGKLRRRPQDEPNATAEACDRRNGAPPITWRDEAILLAPALAMFVFVSSQTGFSRYFRYVLPCLPLVYIWLGQSGRWFDKLLQSRRERAAGLPGTALLFTRVVGAALLWSIISSLAVFPHSMSYFNELAGGPRNGHRYLVDANIDWGQDMYHLRNWIAKHPQAAPLHAAFLQFVRPANYGIAVQPPSASPVAGWHAMSIHRIRDEKAIYRYFLQLKPVALVGYSIYIYHLAPQDAAQVREALSRMPPPVGEAKTEI